MIYSRLKLGISAKEPFLLPLAKATGEGGGAGGIPSTRVERVCSGFWVEAVIMAWEISRGKNAGGMTGVAVLVETEVIVFVDIDEVRRGYKEIGWVGLR